MGSARHSAGIFWFQVYLLCYGTVQNLGTLGKIDIASTGTDLEAQLLRYGSAESGKHGPSDYAQYNVSDSETQVILRDRQDNRMHCQAR